MKRQLLQFRALLAQSIHAEWASAERWLSPLLFALTMLLLFSFAFGRVEPAFVPQLFVAATFLTAFFALQIAFSRVLEPDMQDRVFDQLRSYPIAPTAWFLSKYLLVLMIGLMILGPTLVLADLFINESTISFLSFPLFAIAACSLIALGALGVLLSTMMLRSNARQILYPLLYFPLTTPVLLAAVESSKALLIEQHSLSHLMSSWLGLLVISGIMYFTLSLLLFGELVKPE
ncbi:MAG TPA: heme exporter protein CcmB [Oligoflexus sp.]|jgi:heme exporter protein B|uniref:heme exporter protein CcmB n=1 Tax=Oligoflexus sp. TaxID=1971216 RepID=UPI002D7EE934|nr:heme exporter protein CcmB [Oligoflexus sp.]HET9240188.1 heme exporter protein CcmB [Oligoflexus sp.]